MSFGQGWGPPQSTVGSGTSGPPVLGPSTTVAAGSYQALVTDSLLYLTGGSATTVTLASAANGVRVGQQITIVSVDTSGTAQAIVPSGSDLIDGGTQWDLGEYYSFVTLQARTIVAGVINWTVVNHSVFEAWTFPIQPALAAGAQGPLSLGTLIIPQGPRFVHSFFAAAPVALTGGTITITITGPSGGPRVISLTSAAQLAGTLVQPGNTNELTVPSGGIGAIWTASLSTNAAFAPAMQAPAVLFKMWG